LQSRTQGASMPVETDQERPQSTEQPFVMGVEKEPKVLARRQWPAMSIL